MSDLFCSACFKLPDVTEAHPHPPPPSSFFKLLSRNEALLEAEGAYTAVFNGGNNVGVLASFQSTQFPISALAIKEQILIYTQ